MTGPDSILVPQDELTDLITSIFEHAACSTTESQAIAENLVDANLTGHDSHGVIRVPRYVDGLASGRQYPGREIELLVDLGGLVLVDGVYGMGQTVGPQAVRLGIERCEQFGAAVVALRNAGHLGRIGVFAELAAAADLVSIHIVNVVNSRLVAPFGSRDRRLGTNPIAMGVPRAGRPPIIHDFATSIVAEGKAFVALMGGPAIPDDALVGPHGITGDPEVLYDLADGERPDPRTGPGALRAMGEHKGSGLAVMCELLAGALTGGGTAGPAEAPFANGMLSVYIDPARLDVDDTFAGLVGDYVDWLGEAAPLDPSAPVLLPGDRERHMRAQRSVEGLPLPADVWHEIVAVADSLGVDASARR